MLSGKSKSIMGVAADYRVTRGIWSDYSICMYENAIMST